MGPAEALSYVTTTTGEPLTLDDVQAKLASAQGGLGNFKSLSYETIAATGVRDALIAEIVKSVKEGLRGNLDVTVRNAVKQKAWEAGEPEATDHWAGVGPSPGVPGEGLMPTPPPVPAAAISASPPRRALPSVRPRGRRAGRRGGWGELSVRREAATAGACVTHEAMRQHRGLLPPASDRFGSCTSAMRRAGGRTPLRHGTIQPSARPAGRSGRSGERGAASSSTS